MQGAVSRPTISLLHAESVVPCRPFIVSSGRAGGCHALIVLLDAHFVQSRIPATSIAVLYWTPNELKPC
jgi:hypothetical protein